MIGSVTDGYIPQEERFGNTRRLLEQLRESGADILICTKSDLVLRDANLLKEMGRVTVSWSVNTLDEGFRADMDRAVSIRRRLGAMRHACAPSALSRRFFRGLQTLRQSLRRRAAAATSFG